MYKSNLRRHVEQKWTAMEIVNLLGEWFEVDMSPEQVEYALDHPGTLPEFNDQ